MTTLQILSHADTNEIGSIANNSIQELQKSDWTSDLYLSTTLGRLKDETTLLTEAVGVVRKKDFTEKLMVQDDIFDQVFIGTKQFVKANTFSLDDEKAKNAGMILDIVEAHDVNLYRMGYGEQIFLCQSLLDVFEEANYKAAIASLDGVSAYVALLKTHNDKLRLIFQASKIEEASKEDSISASAQKNVVRQILNTELYPYLEVMSRANADVYSESYKVILEYVSSVNIQVRARKTRNENQEEEDNLPE